MNSKLFNKNIIINSLIIFSIVYGVIMYMFRTSKREKTLDTQIKNKQNIDELLMEIENNLTSDLKTTTHFYNDDLPENMKSKIDIVNDEILELLGPEYQTIPQINEVYFTAKKTGNSDYSFTNLHTDSPFYLCDTYRVLVCIKPNDNVTTIIPDDNYKKKLEKYDVLGFDYANTLHYITIDNSTSSESRIVLKLHFAKSDVCKKLTKRYTRWARSLYVNNLNSMGFNGYGMLFAQFVASYMIYFIIFYLLLAILYFTSNKQNNILMYILLTALIPPLWHIIWGGMFFFIDY